MIIKSYELNKIDFKKNKFYLFHGKNEGLKKDILLKKKGEKKINNYDEKFILEDTENFFNIFLNKSFFEEEKLIVINRATDKILPIIEELTDKQLDDDVIIINSEILDKKSKLRKFFETEKKLISIPFYEDNYQTLSSLAQNYLKSKNLKLSNQSINLIIERAKNDRINLVNELEKIACFSHKKKTIEIDQILKLTNLAENYEISELTDQCLAKNTKKTLNILNENNPSPEENILIIRNFLYKLKRLEKLKKNLEIKKNIDEVISSYKPPIFWKDKDLIKQQLKIWSLGQIKNFIKHTNSIELLIKKNSYSSNHIINDFIFQSLNSPNNKIL